MLKRFFAPILTVLLALGVGCAIYVSMTDKAQVAAAVNNDDRNKIYELKGVIGSEKESFFRDPETIAALERLHIRVTIEKAGSREIATIPNLSTKYDFVFPAGSSAAEKIKREQNIKNAIQPFATPMVVASWKPIADILIANNIVTKRGETYYIIDMGALFDLISKEKRWTDLKNHDKYPANKSILVSSTDVKTSNSAAMYLAQASYVLNNNDIVQTDAQIDAIMTRLSPLFSRQGYTESSTEIPFQDYLTMGMGKSPLVMIYEAQFLRESSKVKGGALKPDMIILYPEPTLFTKHIFIPLSINSEKLSDALMNDSELKKIAVRYGFRTSNTGEVIEEYNRDVLNGNSKSGFMLAPPELVNVIDAPSFEILEKMITKITSK